MIGNNIIPNIELVPNITLEKTVPCTNDFFDPQNNAVILSSVLNFNTLQITFNTPYKIKNIATTPINIYSKILNETD